MNDTGVTPERRNPSENGHSWSLSCNVAFDEILELRKNPVDGVAGTRPSGYSHTSVPTLVDELHRCSLLGDELLGSFLQAPLRCLGRSSGLPTRLGEFDPSALHQYSRTVTRSEVTDACWVFTVRWSAFSLWDVIRVRPNSVLPPVGAWSGRRKFSRSVDRGQGQADVPAEQPTPRARSRLPSSYAYACRSCNRFCASRQGPQGTHRLNHCSSELRSSGCYLSRTDCTAARISRVPCVEAVEWEDKTWLFTRSRETTHVRSSLSAPPDSD